MKKSVLLLAILFFAGFPTVFSQQNKNDDLSRHRIMTCNIRVALEQDEETGNGWSSRRDFCIRVMKGYQADIYCLQEVLGIQDADIKEAFPGWIVLGYPGPEMDNMPDDGYHGIAKNTILFSPERYELLGAGTYWLSETPHIGGSISWESARARHVNWIRLKDKRTRVEFRVLNVHLDHINQTARKGQVALIMEETGHYPSEFPQILAGDFNIKPSNSITTEIRANGWKDSYLQANGEDSIPFSAHAFKGEEYTPKTPGRIDYIYTKGGNVECRSSQLVKDSEGGKYPSDHYFLYADLIIE